MVAFKPENFTGAGFETDDLTAPERGQLRQMLQVLDGSFVSLDKYELAGVRLLGTFRRSWYLVPMAFSAGAAPKAWEFILAVGVQ